MRKILLLFLLAALGPATCFAQGNYSDSITITTYYPAPYGVYAQMQTKTLGVGDTNRDGSFNSQDVPPKTRPGEAWIAGNLSVGTTAPYARLHVNGPALFGANETTGFDSESCRVWTKRNHFGPALDALFIEKTDDDPTVDGAMFLGFATSTAIDTPISNPGWAINHVPVMALRWPANVGIGTTTPQAKATGSGYLDAKDVWVRDAAGGGAWITSGRIIGTFERFLVAGPGTYVGCLYAWGAGHCSPDRCTRGRQVRLMSADDHIGAGEIPGWGATFCHVELYGCVQD